MTLKEIEADAINKFYEVLTSLKLECECNGFYFNNPLWSNLSLDDLPNEKWYSIKTIGGNEYQISNYSRFKSFCYSKTIILKQYFDKGGYLYVSLNTKKYKVHRLMAFTFHGIPINDKMQVNHKKGYKWYNLPFSLEWLTAGQNQSHALSTGLKRKFFGKENSNSVPIIQYGLAGNFIKSWESMCMAATNLDIDDAPIAKCCKGDKNYTQAYGFIWKYKSEVEHIGIGNPLPIEYIKVRNKPKFEKRRSTTILNKL